MRLFIAVPLPESVKIALETASASLGQNLPRGAIRWVRPAQMHLTLRFLGETAVSQLPSLQDQLTQLTSQHPSFVLQLNGIGVFPSRKKPRVVWAGLGGEVAALQALQAGLATRLLNLGWPQEKRPFRPHITLGRVKDAKKAQKLRLDVALAGLEIGVTAVHLVQSELRPSGAVYTVKQIAKLARK
jgi:RNA 2',3'-cyclic 3'-phosphodiesterase